MAKTKVAIEQSALLVVDVQESFKEPARWQRRSSSTFEAEVERLVVAYRAAGLPVTFILHTDDDERFRPDSPELRLMAFLTAGADEPVLLKNTRNAFTSTRLKEILDQHGIGRLAIVGIQTEQCCETTARLAADLGYDVDFVIDATLTFPIADPTSGEELSTAEILRRTAFVLRGRFARLPAVAELVAELSTVRAVGAAAGA